MLELFYIKYFIKIYSNDKCKFITRKNANSYKIIRLVKMYKTIYNTLFFNWIARFLLLASILVLYIVTIRNNHI